MLCFTGSSSTKGHEEPPTPITQTSFDNFVCVKVEQEPVSVFGVHVN